MATITFYHSDRITDMAITAIHSNMDKLQPKDRGTIRNGGIIMRLGAKSKGLHIDREFLDKYAYPSVLEVGIPSSLHAQAMKYCQSNFIISTKTLKRTLAGVKKRHNGAFDEINKAKIMQHKKLLYKGVVDTIVAEENKYEYKSKFIDVAVLAEFCIKTICGDICDIGLLLKYKMTKEAKKKKLRKRKNLKYSHKD
eukprot:33159_1